MVTFSQAFLLTAGGSYTPPGAPATNGIAINLAGAQGAISPFIFGTRTEGLVKPADASFSTATNVGWQNMWKSSFPNGLLSLNTEGSFGAWPDGSFNNQSMDPFWQGLPDFWDNSKMQFVFTAGNIEFFPSMTAAQVVTVATFFETKGFPCTMWEIWNEPDYTGNPGTTTWGNKFASCKTALQNFAATKSHTYKVGGPAGQSSSSTNFFTEAKTRGVDFVSYHSYPGFGTAFSSNTAAFSAAMSQAATDITNVRTAFTSATPISLGEWSMNFVPNDNLNPVLDGGIFASLYLYSSMTGHSTQANGWTNVQSGGVWTIGQNSLLGIVNNDGTVMRPNGYVLSILNQKMAGNLNMGTCQYGTSVGGTKIRCMGAWNSSSGNWTVWLTNFDTGTPTVPSPIVLTGLTGSTYNSWQINPTNAASLFSIDGDGYASNLGAGYTTTPTITTGNSMSNGTITLSASALPARSVTVLSNH